MNAQAITVALNGQWHGTYGTAQCLAHDDREPSLKLCDDPGKRDEIDVHCFAGCDWRDVKAALRRLGLLGDRELDRRAIKSRAPGLQRSPLKANPSPDTLTRSKAAKAIWQASKALPDTPAETYLRERGLQPGPDGWPPTLRYHPALKHYDTGLNFPALIAAVSLWPGCEVRAVHRTFLKLDGTAKAVVTKPKLMLGPCGGGAVRLDHFGETLVLAEGIESGLSVQQATGLPTWACLSTSGLKSIILPPDVRTVVIAADNDDAGIKAAEDAAARLTREGRKVKVAKPPANMDFNDVLRLPENVAMFRPREAAHG